MHSVFLTSKSTIKSTPKQATGRRPFNSKHGNFMTDKKPIVKSVRIVVQIKRRPLHLANLSLTIKLHRVLLFSFLSCLWSFNLVWKWKCMHILILWFNQGGRFLGTILCLHNLLETVGALIFLAISISSNDLISSYSASVKFLLTCWTLNNPFYTSLEYTCTLFDVFREVGIATWIWGNCGKSVWNFPQYSLGSFQWSEDEWPKLHLVHIAKALSFFLCILPCSQSKILIYFI